MFYLAWMVFMPAKPALYSHHTIFPTRLFLKQHIYIVVVFQQIFQHNLILQNIAKQPISMLNKHLWIINRKNNIIINSFSKKKRFQAF